MIKPTDTIYLAVDITDTIVLCSALPGIAPLYEYYPLKDMISDLYFYSFTPDADEPFYNSLEELVPAYLIMNMSDIELFVHMLHDCITLAVTSTIGNKYEDYTYTMKQWLNGNCLLLEVKPYENQDHNDSMPRL